MIYISIIYTYCVHNAYCINLYIRIILIFYTCNKSLTPIVLEVCIQIQLSLCNLESVSRYNSLSVILSLYQSRYNSLTCILKCVFIDTQNYRTLYSLPSNITLTVIKQSLCQLTIFKVYMIQVKMKLTDRSFQRLRNIVIYARHVN